MMKRPFLGAAVVLVAAVSSLSSQTLYTIHGGVAGTSNVTELKGPPGLPFGFPGGPVVSTFPTTLPFACPTVGPIPTPPLATLGDVAFDTVADVVWATDGLTVTSYTPAGAPIVSFPVPAPLGPLTGLGFNSAAATLVMTDGVSIVGAITFGAGCVVPIVSPVIIPSPSPGLLTDIEWDPISGTFFGCDTLGFVTNIAGFGVGPFGIFPAAGLCVPGLAPTLQGLAVDTTAVGVPVLYVTDGFVINRLSPPGAVAPPTFFTPASCYPVMTTAPINGLALSLHPVTFSLPCHTAGGLLSAITSTGNSTEGGAMTVGVVTPPGPVGPAFLLLSFGIGPPLLFGGCSVPLAAPTQLIVPVPPGGLTIPFTIPPAWPAGTEVFFQWVAFTRGGLGFTPVVGFTVGEV